MAVPTTFPAPLVVRSDRDLHRLHVDALYWAAAEYELRPDQFCIARGVLHALWYLSGRGDLGLVPDAVYPPRSERDVLLQVQAVTRLLRNVDDEVKSADEPSLKSLAEHDVVLGTLRTLLYALGHIDERPVAFAAFND